MDLDWQTIAASVAAVYATETLRRGAWGFSNLLADKWLRRNGWDEEDKLAPMVDYTPFWCLFTGVDHLTPKKRFDRSL